MHEPFPPLQLSCKLRSFRRQRPLGLDSQELLPASEPEPLALTPSRRRLDASSGSSKCCPEGRATDLPASGAPKIVGSPGGGAGHEGTRDAHGGSSYQIY